MPGNASQVGRPPRAQHRGKNPHLPAYLKGGAGVGFVLGALLAVLGPQTDISSPIQQVVLLGTLAGALGVLCAAALYLVVDWYRHLPRW